MIFLNQYLLGSQSNKCWFVFQLTAVSLGTDPLLLRKSDRYLTDA